MADIVKGEDCLLEFYQSGEWVGYGCARSFTLRSTTEVIETTVKGAGKYKYFTPTVNSFSGSMDGIVAVDDSVVLTLYKLRQFQLAHVLQRVRYNRRSINGNYYIDTVEFFITDVADTTSFDNLATFTCEMQGTGVIDQTIIEPPLIITKVKRYEYTGTGGETGFTQPLLINKDIVAVHKDGLGNSKIITAGSPASKEVFYDILTGQFLWAVEFEAAEEAYVLYQDL